MAFKGILARLSFVLLVAAFANATWPDFLPMEDLLPSGEVDDYYDTDDVDAQGCCLPKTYQGVLYGEAKIGKRSRADGVDRGGQAVKFAERLYVDQPNQRIAIDLTLAGRRSRNISYIVLFSGKGNSSNATLYTFCKVAKKCTKKVIKGAQLRPQCLPADAKLLLSFNLGAGSGALKSQSWYFRFNERRVTGAASIILTPGNCVPLVSSEVIITRGHRSEDEEENVDKPRPKPKPKSKRLAVSILYTNMQTQISDPSVFQPPSYCSSKDEEKEEEEDETLFFEPDFDFTPILDRFMVV